MPIILDGTTGITTPGITNTGTFVFQGPVQVPAGSAATASITTAAGANTGIFFPSSSSVAITTAGTQRFVVSASGDVGLGVTPSAWSQGRALEILNAGYGLWNGSGSPEASIYLTAGTYFDGGFKYSATSARASHYYQYQGQHVWSTAPSGTAGNAITFTAAMTLDASGNLLVGATSQTLAGTTLQVGAYQTSGTFSAKAIGVYYSTVPGFYSNSYDGTYSIASIGINSFDNSNGSASVSSAVNGAYVSAYLDLMSGTGGSIIRFRTGGNTERARITSAGEFLVGQTGGSVNTVGAYITGGGQGAFCTSGDTNILVNRKASDGTLISFRQDDNEEGTISVSGATVSYNAFAGSHWSQLQDGSKPDILRGTVMESINELCVWPGEQNERLPKAKISDTAGSKKVYGVFMAWDNDWTATNDMYVTAVGAFICRVNGSVTVQEGDLLESNGDGTARVQADDIIRSSTIGKVTSTVKTHQYDDGSYCVPTVLYCG